MFVAYIVCYESKLFYIIRDGGDAVAIVFIDADSVPQKLRAIILRRVLKERADAFFVADRPLPDVLLAIEEDKAARRRPYRGTMTPQELKAIGSGIRMSVVEKGQDSADDRIVELASAGDLAITHDIPLASRLLQKGVEVIDDRGGEYTAANIAEKLGMRANNAVFREMGLFGDRSHSFGDKEIRQFSSMFDAKMSKLFSN